MLGPLLDVSIIADGKTLPECEFENFDLQEATGRCKHSLLKLNSQCSVLVTREVHGSHVTLELIGSVSQIDGDEFVITFSNISEDTLKQIDSIILFEREKH